KLHCLHFAAILALPMQGLALIACLAGSRDRHSRSARCGPIEFIVCIVRRTNTNFRQEASHARVDSVSDLDYDASRRYSSMAQQPKLGKLRVRWRGIDRVDRPDACARGDKLSTSATIRKSGGR